MEGRTRANNGFPGGALFSPIIYVVPIPLARFGIRCLQVLTVVDPFADRSVLGGWNSGDSGTVFAAKTAVNESIQINASFEA
jgi:hypothetical protein